MHRNPISSVCRYLTSNPYQTVPAVLKAYKSIFNLKSSEKFSCCKNKKCDPELLSFGNFPTLSRSVHPILHDNRTDMLLLQCQNWLAAVKKRRGEEKEKIEENWLENFIDLLVRNVAAQERKEKPRKRFSLFSPFTACDFRRITSIIIVSSNNAFLCRG